MGSLDKACIAGFLCRLCSEMHRTVIHIYGDKGRSLGLAQKINDYLPVTVSSNSCIVSITSLIVLICYLKDHTH